MEKELMYLEELLGVQEYNWRIYSEDLFCTQPKKGYEKEWQETKDKIEMLYRIMKAVCAEQLSIRSLEKDRVGLIAEKLLNESATAYVRAGADSTEVWVYDGIHQKVMATFEAEIGNLGNLIFKKAQFY